MGKAKKVRWTIYEIVMIVLAIIFIFPAWIVLTNSFKPLGDILADTFGFPKGLFLDNFSYVLENMNYPRIFLNTVTICVCAIAITVVLSAMCAYRLSRWNNKISKVILGKNSRNFCPRQKDSSGSLPMHLY
ncbi:MAG: carbohydrate ABC transporter permease [Dorea sp.]|nr:carbohydrate ABC transporter permease [Dorea sp.]